jgi:hypothetical protein
VNALQLNYDTSQHSTWVESKAPPIPFGYDGPSFAARYSHNMLQLSNTTLLVLGGVTLQGRPADDVWMLQLTVPSPDPEDPSDEIDVNQWLFGALIAGGVVLLIVLIGTLVVKRRNKNERDAKMQRRLSPLPSPNAKLRPNYHHITPKSLLVD